MEAAVFAIVHGSVSATLFLKAPDDRLRLVLAVFFTRAIDGCQPEGIRLHGVILFR